MPMQNKTRHIDSLISKKVALLIGIKGRNKKVHELKMNVYTLNKRDMKQVIELDNEIKKLAA